MSIVLTGFTSLIGDALLNKFVSKGEHVYCLGRNKYKNNNNFIDYKYKTFFILIFNQKIFVLFLINLSISNLLLHFQPLINP